MSTNSTLKGEDGIGPWDKNVHMYSDACHIRKVNVLQ
jgi:hypothetical protein